MGQLICSHSKTMTIEAGTSDATLKETPGQAHQYRERGIKDE
jgi:hypothetical protein